MMLIGMASLLCWRLKAQLPLTFFPQATLYLVSAWFLLESARLTVSPSYYWENRLVMVPAWRMFADGGIHAGESWRLTFQTPEGEMDATPIGQELLPHLWRDRFYKDLILHYVLKEETSHTQNHPFPMVNYLLQTTEMRYREHQIQMHENPVILNARFDVLPSPRPPSL